MPNTQETELLVFGPRDADRTLILAHGAGQGMRSEFMTWFAESLAMSDVRAVLFEFPYMRTMSDGGKRRPPNPEPVLLASWRETIARLEEMGVERSRLAIGGKSLGGRMASLIADEAEVAGLVCLGYPFHAPGKPEHPRIAHLQAIRTPTLICQGERDPFGRREEVSEYTLSDNVRLLWLEDGEHSFKPRKSSGLTPCANRERALEGILEFLDEVIRAGESPQGSDVA